MIKGRCFYCGKLKNNPDEWGCCKEHSLKTEKIIKENLESDLCACGDTLWVDSKGVKYAVCYSCLKKNNKLITLTRSMLNKLRDGNNE
jgi:hypothetical protein